MWRRLEGCFVGNRAHIRKKKRMRYISASRRDLFAPSLFVRSVIQTHMLRMFRQCITDLTLYSQNRSFSEMDASHVPHPLFS